MGTAKELREIAGTLRKIVGACLIWGTEQCEEILMARQKLAPEHQELREFGIAAYQQFEEWFGPPKDHDRPCQIIIGYQKTHSYCHYNYLLRRYIISISEAIKNPLERKNTLAHEMYHRLTLHNRVTTKTGGLNCHLWFEEMMAQLASHKWMSDQGHADYILKVEKNCRHYQNKIPFDALCKLERQFHSLRTKERMYPDGFSETVTCLGAALSVLVKWEDICQLVKADSLEEWMASLPEKPRWAIASLLCLPCDDLDFRDHAGAMTKLGFAHFRYGNPEAASACLRKAIALAPHDPRPYLAMGWLLSDQKRWHDAIANYVQAVSQGIENHHIYFRMGQAYREIGKYHEAAESIQKSIAFEPEDSNLLCYLGIIYQQAKEYTAAQDAYKQVIALNNSSDAVEAAKKSLLNLEETQSLPLYVDADLSSL